MIHNGRRAALQFNYPPRTQSHTPRRATNRPKLKTGFLLLSQTSAKQPTGKQTHSFGVAAFWSLPLTRRRRRWDTQETLRCQAAKVIMMVLMLSSGCWSCHAPYARCSVACRCWLLLQAWDLRDPTSSRKSRTLSWNGLQNWISFNCNKYILWTLRNLSVHGCR